MNSYRIVVVFSIFSLISGCSIEKLYPIGPAGDSLHDSNGSDSDSNTETTDTNDTHSETDTVDTTSDTESDTSADSDSDSNSDIGTDTGTETDSETDTDLPVIALKWVGNVTQNRQYPNDFFSLWQQVTPENEGKWDSIEVARDVMYWDEFDMIYNQALTNDILFKQHTFIWGEQEPAWLWDVSADEIDDEIDEWISAFCSRYPEIPLINVVLAPTHQPPSFADAIGGAGTTGYDWVIWVYERARVHCPNAKLLVDDHNVLRWQTDQFIAFASLLMERELIDGIGCAGHGLETIQLNELSTNLDKVAALGLPLYISEYDLDLEDDDEQLNVLQNQFPIFYNHPRVAGITFWGYVEGLTWKTDAYLRYANGTPRPALTWLMDYLNQ